MSNFVFLSSFYLFIQSRIILGSDYPFPLGEHHPGKLVESVTDWTEELKDKILSGNALEFLGLDKDFFLAGEERSGITEEDDETIEPPAKVSKLMSAA